MRIHVVRHSALLVLCAGVALGATEGNQGRAKAGPKPPWQDSTCNGKLGSTGWPRGTLRPDEPWVSPRQRFSW